MKFDRAAMVARAGKAVGWAEQHIPRGLRSVVGVLFLAGGALGFLPVLGFWMIPVGLAFIALDIPPLRSRMHGWFERRGIRL